MIFPLWALFGIGAAFFSSCILLLQERLQLNGYVLAFWTKATCALVVTPFVIVYGFPENPLFYVFIALGAVLWAISDVVFFSGISKSSAAAVSRLIPAASILGFLLWFAVNPALLQKYAAVPVVSIPIFGILCLSAFLAMRMKKCEVSMQAVRSVWFVIFAATVGPLIGKTATTYATREGGLFAYIFVEALMMMALWLVYLGIRQPIPLRAYVEHGVWMKGLLIGCFSAGMVMLNVAAFYAVDNPAYIPAVKALDSVIILLIYKVSGRKIHGDLVAGLGIVACAAALIVLKAQIPR